MESRPLLGVKKGAWSKAEDALLRKCIESYGEGKWHLVPFRAGLNRCRKSCRLRWLNYLRPDLNRNRFSEDEVDLLIRLHKLVGNRWSLIAGRLPGRTGNDVKNFWNSHSRKRIAAADLKIPAAIEKTIIYKPKPIRLFNQYASLDKAPVAESSFIPQNPNENGGGGGGGEAIGVGGISSSREADVYESSSWWKELLETTDRVEKNVLRFSDFDDEDLLHLLFKGS